MASLDHSMWFHAPLRADEWIQYETTSERLIRGRGLVYGRMYRADGVLAVSVAQEGVIRLIGDAPTTRTPAKVASAAEVAAAASSSSSSSSRPPSRVDGGPTAAPADGPEALDLRAKL